MAGIARFSVKRRRSEAPASWCLSQDEVAKVAYELFERRGGTHGHDLEDWLQAERIVRQRRGNGSRR